LSEKRNCARDILKLLVVLNPMHRSRRTLQQQQQPPPPPPPLPPLLLLPLFTVPQFD
jgi:hypothetical protein